MQMEMPGVLDLSKETDATLDLYGLERGSTKGFAWQCLIARRLAERGVRFIELIDTGSSNNWDSHSDMKAHAPLAKNVDKPIAGLLRDLKSRGMLEDTLVVWTTEFGRSPTTDGPTGRSHHAPAFSSWLAGAGVKPGMVYGKTDELGGTVAENQVHVHDFHATILHLLGFDHERLTFRHAGRDFRLTDVAGRVVKDILA
jgi:membrane-anchored protein YejM (alkaline phosphatase superfamily)